MSIVNNIIGKVGSFLAGCSYMDLAILGVIVLIPVLAIILAIATGASRKRRVDRLYVDRRASRPVRRRKKNRYEDTYYLPRKHRVRYIKTMKPRGRKQVKVQRVYGKADQSAMLATGLFGVGLGVMAYKAAIEEKRKFYM